MTHQHQDRYDDVTDHSEAFDLDDQSLLQLSRELQTRYDFKVKEYKEQLTSDIQLCSVKWNHIILTASTVVFATFWVVSLPLCVSGLVRIESDVFTAVILGPLFGVSQCIWLTFVFRYCLDNNISFLPSCLHELHLEMVLGLTNAIACVFQVYSSAPWRTPPHLQVLLQTTVIPFTVMMRYLILKQGLTWRQGVCVSIVMFGLSISILPQLFPIAGSSSLGLHPEDHLLRNSSLVQEEHPLSPLDTMLWPCIFALSYLPFSVMCVYTEVGAKQYQYHPLNLCMYMQLFSFVTGVLLFWTDILPYFGMADTFAEFKVHQARALDCVILLGEGDCNYLTSRMWVYMWSNSASFVSQFFLIAQAEGAVYSVLVLALTLPIGTLFWTLFSDNGTLLWDPKFESQTLFSISGIFLLVPPIIMYDYFGVKFENDAFGEEKKKNTS